MVFPVFESSNDKMVYLTSIGLGMSMLFSFNSFISSPDYVQKYYKYAANDPHAVPQHVSFWKNAESFISVSNMLPNLVFQGIVFTKIVRRIPMQNKLLVAMALIIFAMFLIPVLPAFSACEDVAAVNLVFASALAGAATAFFQSTAFALVASFPAKHMGGILFGIGLSGTTTCLIQIITTAAMAGDYNDTQTQSRVFFGVAIGFMFISFVSVMRLKNNPYAQRYIVEYRGEDYIDDGQGVSNPSAAKKKQIATNIDEEEDASSSSAVSKISMATQQQQQQQSDETSSLIKNEASLSDNEHGAASPSTDDEHGGATEYASQESIEILPVIKKIWPMMFSCTLTFFITLTVFPGVGVAVNNGMWFGIIIIFLFNFGDTIGRYGSNIPKIWLPRRFVPFAAMCRLVVIPLFFICITPKWIDGIVFPYILMFLTGVSNGFIGSMSLVYGPQTPALKSDGERALAGNCMSTALLSGCSAGSLLALLITSYLPNQGGGGDASSSSSG